MLPPGCYCNFIFTFFYFQKSVIYTSCAFIATVAKQLLLDNSVILGDSVFFLFFVFFVIVFAFFIF